VTLTNTFNFFPSFELTFSQQQSKMSWFFRIEAEILIKDAVEIAHR
jgi:hypothetical protein